MVLQAILPLMLRMKDDDASRAGTVRDDAGSLGGYLNLTHTSSGLWADIVALGTRHSMKASTDNNDFRARGGLAGFAGNRSALQYH
ncbi:putative adhesin [Escherichia coli]|nr:putative adhesin [Escherichia coli]